MELKHYQGKVRRFYLSHFRRDYVEEQLKKREGNCKMCGSCCQLGYRCPYLNSENTCSVYSDHAWLRPIQCALFPIDKTDLGEARNSQCGYHFKN